jgi:hypothetical protein
MRNCLVSVVLLLSCLAACKKNGGPAYAGNWYIRAPIIENDYTYLDPGAGYNGVYIIYNAAAYKRQWKLIPAGGNEYQIAPIDSPSLAVTDFGGESWLVSISSPRTANQTFRVIPSAQNPYLVAFQSTASQNFIQLEYCHKGNEPWGYNVPIVDSAYCGAYQEITLSNEADTCYCLNRFVLEQD